MLLTADLDFKYPNELVAIAAKSRGASRILKIPRNSDTFQEVSWNNLLGTFKAGDTLVLNDSQVLWARLPASKSSGKKGEIFFLRNLSSDSHWEVLSRSLGLSVGAEVLLPGDLKALVLKTGRICEIQILGDVNLKEYFEKFGEVPLPPYILALRGEKTSVSDKEDRIRYQNEWAREWGSVAAPTAGLHFSMEHLKTLEAQGVRIRYITLHVGAGTFLPIETELLSDFQIHAEVVRVGQETCDSIRKSQASGKRVWACGTTVLRALESAVWASGTAETNLPMIVPFFGETRLFIAPGYKFKIVNGLLTNFHQPQSSLLALAAAFATEELPRTEADQKRTLKKLLDAYQFAIQKRFRLFSYGDLTVMF